MPRAPSTSKNQVPKRPRCLLQPTTLERLNIPEACHQRSARGVRKLSRKRVGVVAGSRGDIGASGCRGSACPRRPVFFMARPTTRCARRTPISTPSRDKLRAPTNASGPDTPPSGFGGPTTTFALAHGPVRREAGGAFVLRTRIFPRQVSHSSVSAKTTALGQDGG